MATGIKLNVFNCLKATDIAVSGWYTFEKGGTQYSIFKQTVVGTERVAGNKDYLGELVLPPGIYQLHIKLRNKRTGLTFQHNYIWHTKDIMINWLRPGNLGDDSVNWFGKGQSDDWHYGGETGSPLIAAHRTTCGNIPDTVSPAPQPDSPTATVSTSSPSTNTGSTPSANANDTDAQRRKKINDYLRTFIHNESSIQSAIDTENRQNRIEGDYLIVYEDVNIENEPTEFLSSCSRADLYPGMLLVVDTALGTNSPTEAFLPRGEVKINIPDFRGGDFSVVVKPDVYGRLQANVNTAINQLVDDFTKTGHSIPAKILDKYFNSQSLDEMCMTLNCSGQYAGVSASVGLESKSSSYNSYLVSHFSQQFYEVKADFGNDLSNLFGPTVTVDDIKRAFSGKAILFVSTVRYGRCIDLVQRLSSNNSSLVQSANVSGYGVSVSQKFSKSKSNVEYTQVCTGNGGDMSNYDVLFQVRELKPNKTDPTPTEKVMQQASDVINRINEYKTKHWSTNQLTKQNTGLDLYGNILSYSACMLNGINPKDVSFWKTGTHKVKKLIRNTGFRVSVFNCLKATDLALSGYYQLCDRNGRLISTQYPLFPSETVNYERTIGNKSFMDDVKIELAPELKKQYAVGRVYLQLRNKRTGVKFSHIYDYPCCDIFARWLRPGSVGGDTVNWYSCADDDWYNDGQC